MPLPTMTEGKSGVREAYSCHCRHPRHLDPRSSESPYHDSTGIMLGQVMRKGNPMHNGCELPVLGPQAQVSGRGSLPHMRFQELASRFSLASAAASPVRSSERLCKKSAERLMVGRNPVFAVSQPAPSQFPAYIALCGGAQNQSFNEWTDFLHSLARDCVKSPH
jgi:hypothetical protein